MMRIFKLAIYEWKHFFTNWVLILICLFINVFINFIDLKGKDVYASTAFFLNNVFNSRVSISFLLLFFVMIPFFYKDKSSNMKELVGSMQRNNYELALSRWIAAVLIGVLFVLANMVILLGIFHDKVSDINVFGMFYDLLYAYCPMILLAASISYALSILFKKPLIPFIFGTFFSVIVVDMFDYVSNMNFLSIASLYKFFELQYSDIMIFSPNGSVLIYSLMFNIAAATMILFIAILINRNLRLKRDQRWQQGIAIASVFVIGFAMFSYNQLYTARQNSFNQKVQAVDIYGRISEKDKNALALESVKLDLNIKKAKLFAKGQIKIKNTSEESLQKVLFNLSENLTIDSIKNQETVLKYSRHGFVIEVELAAPLKTNASMTLDVAYHGGIMEWKKIDYSYSGYESYSYITSNCMYLAPNTGWYPQSASSPIYISEKEKIYEQNRPKELQTIHINKNSVKPFDIEIKLESAPYKVLFSQQGKVDQNVIDIKACQGLFLYGANLESYIVNNRQYYLKKGHDIYITAFERELKKRIEFYNYIISPDNIELVVELPKAYSSSGQMASNYFSGVFTYENIFYNLKNLSEHNQDWVTKEALRNWMPALDNSNIQYEAFGDTTTKLTYENALADYLVSLYNQSGESGIDIQRKLTDKVRNQIKNDSLSDEERNRTDNIKLLYKYLEKISMEENKSSFSEAIKYFTDITSERTITDEDILEVVGDRQ